MSAIISPTGAGVAAPPWQFTPETYGAKGDGKVINDAVISGGALSTLTSASAAFTSADTGKHILIAGAGPNIQGVVNFLATTITYASATTVTLGTAATNAVTNAGALYGTDDTASIQTAINTAVGYANAHDGLCEVLFGRKIYCIAGAFVIGGATAGNAQITLPVVTPSAQKVVLKLTGLPGEYSPGAHWLQTAPTLCGAVLAGMRTDGTDDVNNGPAAVIGGPFNGYGGGGGLFSNAEVLVDALTVTMHWPTAVGGVQLYGMGQAYVRSLAIAPLTVQVAAAPWPQLSSGGIPALLSYPVGLMMPTVGNAGRADIDYYTVYGLGTGAVLSEHAAFHTIVSGACRGGIAVAGAQTSSFSCHGVSGLYWTCESTNIPLKFDVGDTGFGGTQPIAFNCQQADFESYSGAGIVVDNSASATSNGQMFFNDNSTPDNYYSTRLVTAGSGFRLLAINVVPGPVASPQAPPASGSAWLNGYYRDAWITLHATTITALNIDAVAQNGLATSPAAYSFLLPAGHTYTPTYTGALTHTVSLL